MATGLWLYYITDRKQFPGVPAEQRRRLLDKIAEAARCGVHFIQLREKDLSAHDLEQLARDAVAAIRENLGPRATKLLINSRVDVALAVGAGGLHLPANDLTAAEARAIWDAASHTTSTAPAVIGVSCHSTDDIRRAQGDGADFAVFAPVFEKVTGSHRRGGIGLAALRAACEVVSPADAEKQFPVLALGGVTLENARSCIEAGAVGIAGIRLFQDQDVKLVVSHLLTRSRR